MSKNIVVLLLAVLACRVNSYGEVDQNGHPTWEERANHFFVNAVRLDPTNYKAKLWNNFTDISTKAAMSCSSILQTSNYPAVNAVYLTNGLSRSSSNHSLDMATYPCFQHNTCGTNQTAGTRIAQFCNCTSGMGENIAAGYGSPLDVNNQWLCDETNNACAGDKSGSDGHRSNIMSSSFTAIGIGYAYRSSAPYTYYWTQDFSNCLKLGDGTYTSPVYGGTHYPLTVSGTAYTYFSAVWSSSAAPSSANVNIGGTSYSLSLYLGTTTSGIYSVAFTATIAVGTQYYFQFGSQRFPDTGFLVVVGTGYTSSWVAGSTATTPAPVPTTTPAPVPTTTPAPVATTTPAPVATTTPAPVPTTTRAPASTTTPAPVPTTTPAPASTTTRAPVPSTTPAPAPTTTRAPVPTTTPVPVPTTTPAPAPTTTRAPVPTTTPAPSPTTSTTRPAATTTPATVPATTAAPSGLLIFGSALANNWNTTQNAGEPTIGAATFLGQTALKITLAPQGTSYSPDFFWFSHPTDVSSTLYKNLIFNIASTGSNTVEFYFNGEYEKSVSASASAYVTSTTPLSSMLQSGHTTIGSSGHELIFANPSTAAITIYLYNVRLV